MLPKLKEKVTDFKKAMPIIIALRNPSLKQRHWVQLKLLIGQNVMENDALTMGLLLEADVSLKFIAIGLLKNYSN